MAKICQLDVKNFRAIKNFSSSFYKKDFVCFLGRGDSGKTTILDSISSVLSSSWNLSFCDSDFYNCDTETPIEIEASLIDLPESIINENKYGLYIRGLDTETGAICDELESHHEKAFTIRLEVNKDLEPKWFVINNRQEPLPISAYDRAKLNMFMISDYVDRHFSWGKGNPLYAILKLTDEDADTSGTNVALAEIVRTIKNTIDENPFESLKEISDMIKNMASDFGIKVDLKTSVDFRDLSIKDGRVCLHENKIPLRLKGKGAKRLLSIAIQMALAKKGSITLIDEVEQGLEPDRVKQLIKSIKGISQGQTFIVTHSRDVITELAASNLSIVRHDRGSVKAMNLDDNFQNVVRAFPEAFFAKKVIVCEGKTEVGLCRALDNYRVKNNQNGMSLRGCVSICGEGTSLVDYTRKFKELGFDTLLFCDSDSSNINQEKQKLVQDGIKVIDWEEGNSIEDQVFKDLPKETLKILLDYVINEKSENSIKDQIGSKLDGKTLPSSWKETDDSDVRTATAKASKTGKWFKRIDHGEFIGHAIFEDYNNLENKKIRISLDELSGWIDTDA